MIALVLVVGIAVALCVAGWVPLVRAAVRPDAMPSSGLAPVPIVREDDAAPEAVAV